MRPPICCICEERFDPGRSGDQVSFTRRPSDDAFHARMEREGLVGHPPEVEWFCGEHLAAAQALAHLSIAEALHELRRSLS